MLEEQVVSMEEDHKQKIAELEAHAIVPPVAMKQEHVEALCVASTQM